MRSVIPWEVERCDFAWTRQSSLFAYRGFQGGGWPHLSCPGEWEGRPDWAWQCSGFADRWAGLFWTFWIEGRWVCGYSCWRQAGICWPGIRRWSGWASMNRCCWGCCSDCCVYEGLLESFLVLSRIEVLIGLFHYNICINCFKIKQSVQFSFKSAKGRQHSTLFEPACALPGGQGWQLQFVLRCMALVQSTILTLAICIFLSANRRQRKVLQFVLPITCDAFENLSTIFGCKLIGKFGHWWIFFFMDPYWPTYWYLLPHWLNVKSGVIETNSLFGVYFCHHLH